MFDGCLKELEEFSRKNELDGYMTDKEELYHFMENVLLLQLGERNELVYEARQTGALVQTALKDYRRIVLLINSASEFMEAVYSEDFDVSEVLETVFEREWNINCISLWLCPQENMKNWLVTGRFVSLAAGNRESTLEELLMNREFLIMK